MPGPWSSTVSEARPSGVVRPRSMREPGGEYDRVVQQVADQQRDRRDGRAPEPARACMASEMDFALASGSVSDTACRTTSSRSTRSGAGRSAAPSWRASDSNCSIRRVARSMPAVRRCSATRRDSGSPARCKACDCRRSAASGERSSCAASPTNCFCSAKAPRMRSSSRFSSCSSGRISSGTSSVLTGDRSSAGARPARAPASRAAATS